MVKNDPAMDVAQLVYGYTERRGARLRKQNLKLAHYTTADVASKILLNQNVWMRNASSMNDYLEVAFGSDCLKQALKIYGERFAASLNVAASGLCEEVLDWLWRADFNSHQHTHLTSLSEHRSNDELGMLSMWRAYGGPIAGVALVFNTDFLDIDSNELAAWSSPVLYGKERFVTEFEQLVVRLESNPSLLQSIDQAALRSIIFSSLQFSIQSAKHISFL